MELAICKTELPSNKFMLPNTTTAAAFYDKPPHHHQHLPTTAHLNDILNFPSNYLFNKSSSLSNTNNCDNSNISSISTSSSTSSSLTGTTSSTMRLKKNRKVTFLSNLIETKNIFIKEEPVDGSKDLPPPICSISDISDQEASLDVPTQIPPLTPGTNRKVAEVLKASFASWEKEVQNCNITKDPREWTEEHVIYWLNWAIKEFSLVSMNHEPFLKMKGRDIIELGKDKFLAITPAFTGDILWEHLDILQKDCEKLSEDCNIVNTNNSYETATTTVCGSDHQVGFSNNNNSANTTSNNNNNTNATSNNSNTNSRLTPQDYSTTATSDASPTTGAGTTAIITTTQTVSATSDKTATTFHTVTTTSSSSSPATAIALTTAVNQQQHHSGILNGPDIRKVMKSESFTNMLSNHYNHLCAWKALKQVIEGVVGKNRVQRDDIQTRVDNLLYYFEKINAYMTLKLHFLHFHLDTFLAQLPQESDEQGARFDQVTMPMEKRFKGKKLDALLAEVCWWSFKIMQFEDESTEDEDDTEICRYTEQNMPLNIMSISDDDAYSEHEYEQHTKKIRSSDHKRQLQREWIVTIIENVLDFVSMHI